MEVILREHVDHLGRRGDIVKVAAGYARNYLLPRKLGAGGHRSQQAADRARTEERRRARARGKDASGSVCETAQRSGDRDPASRRRERCALRIGHVSRHRGGPGGQGFRDRSPEDHVARAAEGIGEVTVPVKIHRDVTAQVKVSVVPENK